jgi:flagellar basal-body rod modification protein FlgD
MAALDSILSGISSKVTAAPTSSAATAAASSTVAVDKDTLAGNFQAFLQLLTTQLKNQTPLDPLDTTQFTQQLVQFAQVEQQLKSNEQLTTLVSLQKTAQATQALEFVGKTVAVDGATARLANGRASWNFSVAKPAAAAINIKNAVGQLVYSANFSLQAGTQNFIWDGRGNNGTTWPEGDYTMTVTARDASGQDVAVSTGIEGVVDAVDLTQTPPLLSIGGQNFTLDKIKRVVRSQPLI